ncbi:aromatic-ring-hydroxylating dioxygenase [Streptomyces eurocidicus]|uniref:Actinorhodin biosynthesis protein ActVIA n=1 Tax=Streptomyces eurocidicus TaxID=66423 RepID=A0A2N8NZ58_STREU|nr:nuclear transport factor 2 family protein [Streptomyces eurocidicus]MBB5122719.1 actinorhodin biosynthesis protein ActVIA [Streptomyces eurocidicus]MBF6055234.1 nuclear transport factor 2 family protein [Streptomyces eurocidicus]PNE34056.1 aromatic-ring-hydroxylating dioxygenase [Streptomyces eurocidicus]
MNDTATETGLYARVQHFYAHQMQALDGGRFEEYALTFTETGTFQHSPSVEPVRGRAAIVAELVKFHERFAEDPVQRRHWFNHIALTPQPDGSVRSTAYTLVVTVRPGRREPEIAPSCVVHDVLETDGDGIRTRSRSITHDHLG